MENNSGKELIGQYGYARRQSSIRNSMTGQDANILQQLQQEQIQQQQQMLMQRRRSSIVSEASAASVRGRSIAMSNPATFNMSDIYEYEDVVTISLLLNDCDVARAAILRINLEYFEKRLFLVLVVVLLVYMKL